MSLIDNKTVDVKRGNVVLTINAELVDRYIAKGYDLIDKTGNVIKKSVPTDVNSLKADYERQLSENKQLKEQIALLKAQLNDQNVKSEKTTTAKRTTTKK